jgi:twitching motility protein PilI
MPDRSALVPSQYQAKAGMSDAQTPFELLLGIDRRCRALAAGLPSQQETQQTWSGIGFRMGERLFVAPMGEVGEILRVPRHTRLPGVKSWVKGVANVRGRLLPMIDLCDFFGHELSPLLKQRRVLVIEHQDVFSGVIVDEVFGMQHFSVEAFSEQPPPLEAALQPFIYGMFNREQPWLVFSPQALAQHADFLDVAV